jgi:hypothetical protein
MSSFCVISGLVIGLFDFRRTKTERKLLLTSALEPES